MQHAVKREMTSTLHGVSLRIDRIRFNEAGGQPKLRSEVSCTVSDSHEPVAQRHILFAKLIQIDQIDPHGFGAFLYREQIARELTVLIGLAGGIHDHRLAVQREALCQIFDLIQVFFVETGGFG